MLIPFPGIMLCPLPFPVTISCQLVYLFSILNNHNIFINPVALSFQDAVFQGSISKETTKASRRASSIFSFDFLHGFVAALSVIIVSELGDKTFFIAAIMSMRHSRLVVFIGAMGALGLMTVLSAVLGFATTVIPRKYTLYVSTALFVFFGLKMLKEGYEMDPNEGQEELEEVQAELKKKEAEVSIVTCLKLVW